MLDVGCGTGTFALLLAARGLEVTGVDPAGGSLDVELIDVSGGRLVTFRWTSVFASDGQVLTSDSTLCFRERDEVEAELLAHGYTVDDIRGAPDRPDREFVFVALRPE